MYSSTYSSTYQLIVSTDFSTWRLSAARDWGIAGVDSGEGQYLTNIVAQRNST